MTATDPSGTPDSAVERDGLGWFCFVHHLAVMVYIVVGWLLPSKPALLFYVVFLPAVALQWRLNKDSCILNNVESLIRTGQWRDPTNREEGAWLLTLARETLGLPVTAWQVDIFTYAVLLLLWILGLVHLLRP
jgi:hypothetical protein